MSAGSESIDIPGVTILGEIGRGSHSIVLRAIRKGQTVAVKIQKTDGDDGDGSALRLRRAGAILACLHHRSLPRILEIGEVEGRPYLIRELVSGRTLEERVVDGPLPEPAIIDLGIQLAEALSEVHRHGMVHCDVKPANILVDDSGEARLIDFGLAARATNEHIRDVVAGTLLYAAPEQTGMLKRPLDGRSDLYALGAVLYECATGRPPFDVKDVAELVRLHAASLPEDVRSTHPEVSRALAAIIARLLSKDPDDRYQSGQALAADLENIAVLNDELREGPAADVLGHLSADVQEGPLVGRAGELDSLSRRWNRALRGYGSAVLIEGGPGIGKSRLVRELEQRVRQADHLVLTCRCRGPEALPFEPIRVAIGLALQRSRRLRTDDGRSLNVAVRMAAASGAALLTGFEPHLTEVLGTVPEVSGLESVQDQFYDTLAGFLAGLARQTGAMLLIVEDIHRIDLATFQVFSRLAAYLRDAPLLLVATARSSEGDELVDSFVTNMGSALGLRLELPPLDDRAIGRIVAGELGTEAVLGIAERIAVRSDGNPFTAIEYVRSLLLAGVLRPSWGEWTIDEDGFAQIELPKSLLDLVVRRLDDASSPTRVILRRAAVIGSQFDLSVVRAVADVTEEELFDAIGEAGEVGVVELLPMERYGFVHEEIRTALLSELGDHSRAVLHQQVGQALGSTDSDDPDCIYAVARHLARGLPRENPHPAIDANVAAGQRAMSEYAHDQAYGFLDVAQRIASELDIELPTEFSFLLGEVSNRTGRLGEAIGHFEAYLERSTDPIERAFARERLAHTHIANFHHEPCWREVLAGFGELGIRFPRRQPAQLLSTMWFWCLGLFSDLLRIRFGTASGRRRERFTAYAKLCEHGAIAAYFGSRPLLLLQMVFRSLYAATRLGHSPALVTAYCQLAVGFASLGRRRIALRYIARAERVARELNDRLVLARCRLYDGLVRHLCGQSTEGEAVVERALEEHGPWLDAMHYVDGLGDLVFNLMLRGYNRQALMWAERQIPRIKFTNEAGESVQTNPWAGAMYAMMGRASKGLEYQQQLAGFLETIPFTERYLWGELLAYRVLFYIEQGELGAVLDSDIARHRELGMGPLTTSFHFRGIFVFVAYARMEQAMMARDDTRPAAIKRLAGAVRELKWASITPAMRALAVVYEAALRRLQGRLRRADRLLDRAATLSRQSDSPWVSFEVARQRAHLLRKRGDRGSANREALMAHTIATEQGWVSRARKIRSELDLMAHAATPRSFSLSSSTRVQSDGSELKLRRELDALMQVSMAAATVLQPERQARIALDEVVRILGAERGFLWVCPEEGAALEYLAGRDAGGNDLDAPTGFSSTVVETVRGRGEPLVLTGSGSSALVAAESVITYGLKSIVAAPLLVRDRVVGVLYLDNRLARGVFTDADVDILLAIGSHIAIGLETARTAQLEIQFQAEASKRRLAESLRDMSHALSSTLELEEVVERFVSGVTGVIPADRASVFLIADDYATRVASLAGTEDGSLRIPLGSAPLLAAVVRDRRPLVVSRTQRDPRLSGTGEEILGAWIGVPLISQDKVAGVLTLERRTAGSYTDNEAEIAFTFAGQAGIAIENARLFGEVQRLATIDGLTQTLNRRHFFAVGEREIARARRRGTPLCAIMLDIDHFKLVNDTHGHSVGDQVLEEVARRCRGGIREVDLIGRYGGEEFAIVAPDTTLDAAHQSLAERLRADVADSLVETVNGGLQVTISVGVAQWSGGEEDLATVLARADAALYDAKEGGRNRVVSAKDAE
jgi:diguanylate cyclase (GGDEF)-like protein